MDVRELGQSVTHDDEMDSLFMNYLKILELLYRAYGHRLDPNNWRGWDILGNSYQALFV